jgi:gamma-glutamyltranspeptidase/glutathione hydrolase
VEAAAAGHDRLDVLAEGVDGRALLAGAAGPGAPPSARSGQRVDGLAGAGDTTYLRRRRRRHGVSLIQSNAGVGSGSFEPNTGINLHNRPGLLRCRRPPGRDSPAGARPTLSPALVTTPDGRLVAVLGTQGGDGQPQILLQVLARLLHAGQSPADAIGRPRWVLEGDGRGFDPWSSPSRSVPVEANAPGAWLEGLAARGHRVTTSAPFGHQFGHANVITVADPARGRVRLAGAADPRGRISAAVGR